MAARHRWPVLVMQTRPALLAVPIAGPIVTEAATETAVAIGTAIGTGAVVVTAIGAATSPLSPMCSLTMISSMATTISTFHRSCGESTSDRCVVRYFALNRTVHNVSRR